MTPLCIYRTSISSEYRLFGPRRLLADRCAREQVLQQDSAQWFGNPHFQLLHEQLAPSIPLLNAGTSRS